MGLMLPSQREDAPDDPVAAKLECMTLNGARAAALLRAPLGEERSCRKLLCTTQPWTHQCRTLPCWEAGAGEAGAGSAQEGKEAQASA